MPDTAGSVSPGATFNYLQGQQGAQSKRIRPPAPNDDGGETGRVPLRPGAKMDANGLGRRESRRGLRSIFGRHKSTTTTTTDADRTQPPASPRDLTQRPGGIRASIAEISNWPYGLHHGSSNNRRSESVLPPLPQAAAKAAQSRGTLGPWTPPPLFQAYPQAIRYTQLPACTASAEAILRIQNHKGSFSLRDGLNQSLLSPDMMEESTGDKGEKVRKRHRRNTSASSIKLEWTTKIFMLVTAGYLLQYTGEGSFDRLPEKILHLGKDSAAFASDVIPGRHWVLQVSSAADSDGSTTASPVASVFARLQFRSQEKRQASNLLMVFDSADEMDAWIAILRREIEALGGKKHLSETGKPKADDEVQQLKNQTSQRTLVVRDPDRFSRMLSPDMAWGELPAPASPGNHLDLPEADTPREQSFDETSTASWVSQDGRQLDGLRDSTNRLSYYSSGQRTMITSAGSSPACSPIRDSFASHEDFLGPDLPPPEEQLRPRARPNAAAINNRRQSLQTMNHHFDIRTASSSQTLRPHSTYSPAPWPVQLPPLQGRLSSRRPPPAALSINPRPLSFVEDQPSPLSPPLVQVEYAMGPTAPDAPPVSKSWAQRREGEKYEANCSDSVVCNAPSAAKQTLEQGQANEAFQRRSSMRASQQWEKFTDSRAEACPSAMSATTVTAHMPNPTDMSEDTPRALTSFDHYDGDHSPIRSLTGLQQRRLSLYSQFAERPLDYGRPLLDASDNTRRARHSLKPAPRSSQHLRANSHSQGLLQRRSLSQLVEGPPPGPPPTRALPPIPPRGVSRSGTVRHSGGNV
ncbi:hypothetical protein B0T17DRAFT_589601 [Bombardia bombarda]|uniref:PH domain-containing protein n=1 Tax=Bombardia bombarda TaxID=252184 RepID=A0AA40C9F5_9PEZI|nr:hypothetical protein B0T17DRAFT_589601 [Bombardia bombarda]